MSEFKDSLQHHLSQTRAGKFGQFEHGLNFNQGFEQDANYKIGVGENITFTFDTLLGVACTLIVSNNSTGPSGAGFGAQTNPPPGGVISVPLTPQSGDAVLDFSCPTGGGGGRGVQSYCTNTFQTSRDRYEAIDGADAIIFSRNAQTCRDNWRDPASGEWHTVGGTPFSPFFGDAAKFDSSGTFVQRYREDLGRIHQSVYEATNDRVATLTDRNDGTYCVIYDGSGSHQGGPAEPAPLFEVKISSNRFHFLGDIIPSGDGFVYVALGRTTDTYDGATGGVDKTILKIDTASGLVVAAYDLGTPAISQRLAVDSAGNLIVAETKDTVPEDGGAADNVFKFDSSLSLLARNRIDWNAASGGRERVVYAAVDAADDIYIVAGSGYGVRFDSGLTAQAWAKFLFTPHGSNGDDSVKDIGHDQAGTLFLFVGGTHVSFRAAIIRFDNSGAETSRFLAALPASDFGPSKCCHVSPGGGGGPGGDIGNAFTQELSSNPPGKIQAFAAVKYANGEITDVYFNSVDVEIDRSSFLAVHSVLGNIPFGMNGQWDYHSPLL